MALKFDQKKKVVDELSQMVSCVSAIAADYRGLSVSAMTKLRQQARQQGLVVKVVRNNLARRAFSETSFACLENVLEGPILLIFSPEDPGISARLVRSFVKEHEALKVKALMIGSELLEASQLKAVADLPTKEQALANLLSVIVAPMTKFVRTASESYGQFVRVLSNAVAKQK